MKNYTLLKIAVLLQSILFISGLYAQEYKANKVLKAEFVDVSPPLRDVIVFDKPKSMLEAKPIKNKFDFNDRKLNKLPAGFRDTVIQNYTNSPISTVPVVQQVFDGNSNLDNNAVLARTVAPPDTQGDVGPNHYIQMVNLVTTIYNKDGSIALGPFGNNFFWQGFEFEGKDFSNVNDGDPVVLYDQFEDRWIVSQFAIGSTPNYELIAVSKTSDPTGEYYRYAINYGSVFPDYPKLGIWGDALYISTRDFDSGFLGSSLTGLEKSGLYDGSGAVGFSILVPFGTYDHDGFLPGNAEGEVPPDPGTPHYSMFKPYGSGSTLYLATTNPDWDTPANSSMVISTINVAPYSSPGNQVMQPNGQALDALTFFLMFPLHYRNFGSHQSMVAIHTVNDGASGPLGIRWYEFRSQAGVTPWDVYQQGTFIPDDGLNRWMGSIAMNGNGDIAIGYSVASTTKHPSIRFTGQTAGAPGGLGVLDIPETSIFEGIYSQAGVDRWGDYSMMSADPVDDYTFWYTTENASSQTSWNWETKIAKLDPGTPNCDLPSAVCQNITVYLDGAGNATITAADLDGGSSAPCGLLSMTASQVNFTCADVGPNNVTLTITDVNNDSDNCVAVVTVADTTSPSALCQNITVFLDAAGNATITGSDLDGGSSDNCGISSFSATETSFTCTDIGPNNITLTVNDVNGNQSTCVSVVTVTDTITPDPGSIAGESNIDYGSSTGDLVLSGNYGAVQKWQKRFGTSGAWTDIIHTDLIYSETPPTLGTWQYRALVQGSACAGAFTYPHTVNVGTKELTIGGTFTANDKIYDDNTNATFDQNNLTLEGIVGTEDVMLTGLEIDFESKEVGNHTVSITYASLAGADKDNYTLSLTGAPETNADILPGSPDHFLVTDPDGNDISSPKLVNIPFDAKVTLVDAFDNPTPNTGGDVTVTLTGSGGATPGDLRFQGFPADPVTQTLNADESSVDFNSILYTGVSDIPGMDVKIDAGASGAGSADGMTGESNLFSVREIFFTVEASPTTLPADGTSKSDITVTLLDFENNPIADQEITVENDFGTLMEGVTELPALVSRTTDANGQVLLELRADTESAVATVTAKCPGACPHSVEVAFTINAPNITGFTPGENQASVEFNPPTNPGTTTITNYEYSLNDGTDWDPFNPEQDASPVTVSGLTEYQTYPLKLRAVNEAGSGAASNSFEIYACANPTDGGAIAADQNLFEGDTPALLTNETDASGEYGDLEYKWQLSTTSATEAFTDIPAATDATYQPEATFETTWFRRLARVSCKADWTGAAQSNVVQVYIYQPPTVEITSPADGSTTYDATITVSGTASDADNDLASVYARINGGGWQLATGTANWQTDLPVVFGNNLIEAKSTDAQSLESELAAITIQANVQEVTFISGWNHISAYLEPQNPNLEAIMTEPVNANLVNIMNDMHGKIYWPSQNINTIGQWNIWEAYQAKLTGAASVLVSGDMLDDQSLDLEAGFTYLPVLTNIPSPIEDVFTNPQTDVKLIFHHQTVGIYWPDGGLYTLNELDPGMGYLALLNNPATATFPPYDLDALQTKSSGITPPESGPWPVVRTKPVHMISVSNEAIQQLESASYIGAFDGNGYCIGYTDITINDENKLLVVYGDDGHTQTRDGAQEGETIQFRSWNAAIGEETDLTPVYNNMMPNSDGRFTNNGLSMITGFKTSSTGMEYQDMVSQIEIYPNPATDEIMIAIHDVGLAADAFISVIDSKGTTVRQIEIIGDKVFVDVSEMLTGLYVIRVPTLNGPVMKKLIIK